MNTLAAGVQAAAGKKATFTPDMTYGQYTANVADAMGSTDYFQQAKNYITSDQHKKQLAQALGVPPDSDLVRNISSLQAQTINLAGETAADPTSYFSIGEIQALGRGGRALKIGDPKYEAVLQANKVNGGLKLVDDPSAWQFDEPHPALAQDAGQGYTQAGSRARETLEDAVAAARDGVEDAWELGGVVEITPPLNASPEQIAQTKAYIDGSNQALRAGRLSPTGRVSTAGSLRISANSSAAKERARAAVAGTPYKGQVGHVPDTTWTGTADPFIWLDLDPSVNMSIGGQANRYPIGYKPTEFRYRDR